MQIWKVKFGYKVKFLFRLSAQGLVKILKLKFRQDFDAEVWSVFYQLNLGQKFKFLSQDADVSLRFGSNCLIEILKL